jgi:hypothetical protein
MTKHIALILSLATVACSGSTQFNDARDTGSGGAGGSGGSGAISCEIDKPGGDFSFEIENTGSRTLYLPHGCGNTLPLTVSGTDGELQTSPGGIGKCEISCDQIYGGTPSSGGCSDCGPGDYLTLLPGEKTTITWDRRIYVEHMAPSECTDFEAFFEKYYPELTEEERASWSGGDCALGNRVDATTITTSTLSFCETEPHRDGVCDNSETITFPLDLMLNEVPIELE